MGVWEILVWGATGFMLLSIMLALALGAAMANITETGHDDEGES